jgi:hypothetical protein
VFVVDFDAQVDQGAHSVEAHPLQYMARAAPRSTSHNSTHLFHFTTPLTITMSGLRGVLLGLGNPLLDVSAVVDQAFLDKYDVRHLEMGCSARKRRPAPPAAC